MKKKLLSVTLALVLLAGALTACSKPGDASGSNPSNNPGNSDGSQVDAPPTPVDLEAFYESITSQYEFGFLTLAEPEMLDAVYPGMTDIETEQCLVYICMITMNNGEFGLVQVKNSADVDAVKAVFQERIDFMVGDGNGPGGAQYPMSMDMWENYSRTVSNGNYVMMVVNESCDDIVKAFNDLF